MSFDQALSQYLLEPLEMTSTFGIKEMKRCQYWQMDTIKPARFLHLGVFNHLQGLKDYTNLTDLMSFVHAQLGESHTSLDEILIKNITKETSTFNEKTINFRWMAHSQHQNGDLYVHTGRKAGGHSGSYIGMVKETKNAAIVLSNSFYGTGRLRHTDFKNDQSKLETQSQSIMAKEKILSWDDFQAMATHRRLPTMSKKIPKKPIFNQNLDTFR